MADALYPLQVALVATLTGGSPTPFPYSLYTGRAPQSGQMPYAVLGEDTAVDWGTKTEQGQEITATIHSWSKQPTSTVQVKQMMAALYAALHEAEFSVSGQDLVSCRFDFGQVLEDADGQTFHGISRFRLHLSAA
jgi:cellulase/cellobiase CelA1